MTNLTEQWKNGELETGMYYIKHKGSGKLDWWHGYYWEDSWSENVEEVIAPVPSYEELQNMNEAVNQAMAANIKLVEQNKQLKELLKDARNVLKMVDTYCGDNDSINEFLIVKRIDEVLG